MRLFLQVIFTALLNVFVWGQPLAKLQDRYSAIVDSVEAYEHMLVTEKQELSRRADQLDRLKRESASDDKINREMASTILISNRVETLQIRLVELKERLNSVRARLSRFYKNKIDSARNSENEDPERILEFTRLKLFYSSPFDSLSFDPQKLLMIDLAQMKNSPHYQQYRKFMTAALQEIDTRLQKTRSARQETAQMITLQRDARIFLDEIAFDDNLNVAALAPATVSDLRASEDNYSGGGLELDISSSNLESVSVLLNQFEAESRRELLSADHQMSIDKYLEILSDLENKLTEYKAVLENKLEK